jgi:hypothetical protein
LAVLAALRAAAAAAVALLPDSALPLSVARVGAAAHIHTQSSRELQREEEKKKKEKKL